MRVSRGRVFHRRALYRINKWKDDQAKLQSDKTMKTAGSIQKKKPVSGDRNGKERLVLLQRSLSVFSVPSLSKICHRDFC